MSTAPPLAAACRRCLRRSWLIGALAGRIEVARLEGPSRLRGLLALGDEALMRALDARTPGLLDAHERFDREPALAACAAHGLHVVCRHDTRYPQALLELDDAPAALHVAGDAGHLHALRPPEVPVAGIVGARRATSYGLEVAGALGRGLAVAGVPVVSGMALGIDAAAHTGALAARGLTVAVLAGGAEVAYPASKRRLYDEIRATGCVISELPPGTGARRWCFPARNRIIAALSGLTIVVEAAERSGSLITAEFARELGRDVGAVPGPVSSPCSAGTNALLKDGAHVVRHPADALDLVCGVGSWSARPVAARVPDRLRAAAEAVAAGADTVERLAATGLGAARAMEALGELELLGHVRRAPGGRFQTVL